MDKYPKRRRGLMLGILLLFIAPSAPPVFCVAPLNGHLHPITNQNIRTMVKEVSRHMSMVGNTLISNNTGNDYHPRMTTNRLGHTIIVYEQELATSRRKIPVVYSADGGHTWTRQFLVDSQDIIGEEASGILQYPDIVYNAPNDVLYLTMIDPDAEMYNNEMGFIQGDIVNATDALWYGISGAGSQGYLHNACTCTNNFFLSLVTWDVILNQTLGLSWFVYPDFTYPPGVAGFYYDGNSLFQSAPAAQVEMDSNVHQLFIVCETRLDTGSQITIKTNVMDEDLVTSGEQKDGMDKYADPEQMPGEYLGVGTDPDVSGCGNRVCVVYVMGDDVMCQSSITSAAYDPGFNWHVSTVERHASAPAVYMEGTAVYCVYVKSGNVYLKVSEDGGVTWSDAERKNDVDGTVVSEKGAVDICKSGIAFTDTRNGKCDIYWSSYEARPTPKLAVTIVEPMKMTIRNVGDAPAFNVSWNITVNGKFILLGRSYAGVVLGALGSGQEISVGQRQWLLGFGHVELMGTAWAENAPMVSATLTGRLVGFFFFPE